MTADIGKPKSKTLADRAARTVRPGEPAAPSKALSPLVPRAAGGAASTPFHDQLMSMIDATAQENRRVRYAVADIVPDRSSRIHPIILGIGGFVVVAAVGGIGLVSHMRRTPPPVAVADVDQAGPGRSTAVGKDEHIIEPAKTDIPAAKPDDHESSGVEGERLPQGETGADVVPPEKSAGPPAATQVAGQPVASVGSDDGQASGDGAPKIPIVPVRPNPVTTAASPAGDPAPAADTPPVPPPAVAPPAVAPPAAEPPGAEASAADAPAAEAPTVEPPAAEAPTAEPPVVKAPAVKPPVVKAPAIATRAIETGSTTGQTDAPAQWPLARIVSDVKMHAGPSNGQAVVATIPKGTSVEVVDCRAWCEVIFAGQRGWVYKGFIQR